MSPELHALLRAVDDAVGFEIPGDDWTSFPYAELAQSVLEVQAKLREVTGLHFERDGQVQDASFHEELRILSPASYRENGAIALIPEIGLRFSNFGRLFTIYSALDGMPPQYDVEHIRRVPEALGWRYVPAHELHGLYDGSHDKLRDGRTTWWVRFFDYV